ncbi:unnamed protein product [Rotaria sp. Silwood2]|nr:unnamed protein product [Rotaria sp. Silwood2]CAF3076406.1 unnamed protein product [Rotaria sp. Silwood2]CAF3408550.1 unnamed protein product [Rotaria sp. Silwood2]CAF4330097.1 unnamed protein product [Rotaria sp. Silwood2]CAF4377052.1 unnamed protein product [Rotaria sp. Silwood2]
MVDPNNRDIVHHIVLMECDSIAVFNDNKLPDGPCDEISENIFSCVRTLTTVWAVRGDEILEYPDIGGYSISGDIEVKYYMFQMHYDNPKRMSSIECYRILYCIVIFPF